MAGLSWVLERIEALESLVERQSNILMEHEAKLFLLCKDGYDEDSKNQTRCEVPPGDLSESEYDTDNLGGTLRGS